MTDLSHFSDEDLARAAGLPVQAPAQAVPAYDPLSHLSDEELEKIASGGVSPIKGAPAQDESWWREPKLAASNLAKGAISTWAHMMDAAGTAQGIPAQAALNVINRMQGEPERPLTDAVINNQAKNEAIFRDAGIIDRPDLQPQSFGERALAAGAQGVGGTASMGMVNPMALASGFSSGVGGQIGHEIDSTSTVLPLIGSLAGGVAPAGLEALGSRAWTAGRNAFGAYDPSERVDQIITRKLAESPEAVQPSDILKTMRENPDKPLTIADLGGPSVQRIARASLDIPSKGSADATQFLQERDLGKGINGEFDMMRQGGAADRIVDKIKQVLGSDDALKTLDDLVVQGDANAAPLYQKFYEQRPVPARQVQQFMTSPTFRSALNRANASLLDEGQAPLTDYIDFNEAGDPVSVTGKAFPPQTLDRIKQGIDDNWLAAKASGDRGAARTANSLRTRYLNFLDSKYPDTYPQARAAFAGPAAARDAIQQGMDVFSTAPEDVAKTIQSLPPENQDMFRLGVQKALISKVLNTNEGANEVKVLFGKPAVQKSIAAAFNDPQALNDLSQSLGLENRMFLTKGISGNSRTAPSLMDQAELTGGVESTKPFVAAGAHLLGGNPVGAALHLLDPTFKKFIGNIGEGTRNETASLLAQRLFERDPTQNADRLQLLQALMDNPTPPPASNPMAFLPYLNGFNASANGGSRR